MLLPSPSVTVTTLAPPLFLATEPRRHRDKIFSVSLWLINWDSNHDDSGIAHYAVEVSAHIAGICVAYQMPLGSPQIATGGQGRYCGREPAHTDVFFANHAVESLGIHGQYLVDRLAILSRGNFGRLVVVHIGAGDDQHRPRSRLHNPGRRVAK